MNYMFIPYDNFFTELLYFLFCMSYLHIDMLSFLFMGWTLKCFSVHQFAFKFCLWSFTSLSLNWRQLNIYQFLLYHMDFRSRLEWFSPFWNVKRKIYIILILLLFIINLCIIWNLYLGYVWIIYSINFYFQKVTQLFKKLNVEKSSFVHRTQMSLSAHT